MKCTRQACRSCASANLPLHPGRVGPAVCSTTSSPTLLRRPAMGTPQRSSQKLLSYQLKRTGVPKHTLRRLTSTWSPNIAVSMMQTSKTYITVCWLEGSDPAREGTAVSQGCGNRLESRPNSPANPQRLAMPFKLQSHPGLPNNRWQTRQHNRMVSITDTASFLLHQGTQSLQ